jgi:uncharacterized protein (DUF1330 family)
MSSIEPTEEQIKEVMARPDAPVVMVNLLRYKRDAEGNKVGAKSYETYSQLVTPMLETVGARPIWGGGVDSILIADHGSEWDSVLLVEYPSPSAFLQMVTSEEYLAIHHHRVEALEAAGLIATTPGAIF